MENKTKIGIGVVLLAGVGYYFYNKSKSPMTNVGTPIVEEPKKSGFDREKSSKELAILVFSKIMKPNTATTYITDVKTGIKTAVAQPINRTKATELSLYKQILEGFNLILDNSDAEYIYSLLKKVYETDGKYKADLESQIRIDKINEKYPNALKKLDFG
jgi:hypothetical protein